MLLAVNPAALSGEGVWEEEEEEAGRLGGWGRGWKHTQTQGQVAAIGQSTFEIGKLPKSIFFAYEANVDFSS